uniref:Extended FMRFamide-3 n=1 Tax=Austrophasma rawsonvillense TaxID=253137 RepID=FAR3_AUSRA|nr:RecName: Full=Extended FMRFamide-3; Short=FMRFa-3 [Austrophasma rawsonvillense]
GPDSSFLRL